MKKKTVQYNIAEPCHESWGAMTPTGEGRFCHSCAKAVVDFTAMTDQQIVQYMSGAAGSVCGRMTSYQLNRDFTVYAGDPSRNFSLRALVLGTAITTFSALNVHAQGEVRMMKGNVEPVEQVLGQVVKQDTIIRDTVFSGNVIDPITNTFIEAVSVTIYDSEGNELATTLTNANGAFQVPMLLNEFPYSAVFRKEEYIERTYLFGELLTTRNVTVELNREMHIMMGMVARPRE